MTMDLKCSTCVEFKDESLFHKNSSRKTGRAAYCKDCAKKHYSRWQQSNPKSTRRIHEWKLARVDQNRKLYVEYMADKSCVGCGETNILVLDHDHVRDTKTAGVLHLLRQGVAWEKIQEEIEKCEIRCKNCHTIKTAKDQGWWLLTMGVCENS